MSNHDFWIFRGRDTRANDQPVLPPAAADMRWEDPKDYIAGEGLRHAVNVAIALARPLLITGEAGTGKTQLAYRMAYELTPGMPRPLRFQTKARAEASDLFYRYDALRHFQDVHVNQNRTVTARDFLRMEALGIAILLACSDRDRANAFLPAEMRLNSPVRSVVLIDEIDKAPRDLPNDLLSEIEHMYFEIKETGDRFEAAAEFRPVVLLTSNSERDLPDAFLRRCVYYHIPPPSRDALREIVRKRANPSSAFSPEMLENTLVKYDSVRSRAAKKKPGPDELIAWVRVLDRLGIDPANPKPGERETLGFTYSILVKDAGDLEIFLKNP
jgi:MoxR-like ATPase